ncbi:hypothetical protein Tco_0246266 [Tanacetum coccineum]
MCCKNEDPLELKPLALNPNSSEPKHYATCGIAIVEPKNTTVSYRGSGAEKGTYETKSYASFNDKQTGSYGRATVTEKASSGDFHWKNGTSGTRNEYKRTETEEMRSDEEDSFQLISSLKGKELFLCEDSTRMMTTCGDVWSVLNVRGFGNALIGMIVFLEIVHDDEFGFFLQMVFTLYFGNPLNGLDESFVRRCPIGGEDCDDDEWGKYL